MRLERVTEERVRNPRYGEKREMCMKGTGVAEERCAWWVDGGMWRWGRWRKEEGHVASAAWGRKLGGRQLGGAREAWLMGGMAMPTVKVPP